jgi:hypothetical protein
MSWYVVSTSLGHEALQYPNACDSYAGFYWTGSNWQVGSAYFQNICPNGGAVLLTNVRSGVAEQVGGVFFRSFLLSY